MYKHFSRNKWTGSLRKICNAYVTYIDSSCKLSFNGKVIFKRYMSKFLKLSSKKKNDKRYFDFGFKAYHYTVEYFLFFCFHAINSAFFWRGTFLKGTLSKFLKLSSKKQNNDKRCFDFGFKAYHYTIG